MKHIETNIFELIQDKPRMVRIIGRRKAVDVFAELESALKEANLLPDEYFLLDNKFEDENRLVPDLRDVICYANRDGSESIYLDVYLCGYDDVTDKYQRFHFATGKTLREDSYAFDRMQYIAGYIYKLFEGFGQQSSRYVLQAKNKEVQRDTLMEKIRTEYLDYLKNVFVHNFSDPADVGFEVGIRSMIVSELPNCTLSEDKVNELYYADNSLDVLTKMCFNIARADMLKINDIISSRKSFNEKE